MGEPKSPRLTAPQIKLLSAIGEDELLRSSESLKHLEFSIVPRARLADPGRKIVGRAAWTTIESLRRQKLLVEVRRFEHPTSGHKLRWYEKAASVKELR